MTAAPDDIPRRSRIGKHCVALAGILVLALGIRVWRIGAQSLWHDEVLTTLSASVPLTKVVESVEHNENKPPLYFFVMNLWVRIAGMSETALRLPSALFGAAAVGVIYLLGRDLFNDRTVGLIAALMLAFSRFHIWYSQEARTYSLLFLLILLACWFAVRMMQRKAVIDQIGYVLCAALAMYAHPFAAFALLAVNIYYVACYALGPKPATDLRRWLILQLAFSLLFWPWLSRTMLVVRTGLPWIIESTPFPMAMLSYAGSPPLLALLIVLLGVTLGYALMRRERGIVLLALLLLLPTLGPLAFASRLYQTFIPRYGIIAVAALVLLGAYGIARLRPWAASLLCAAYVAISLAHFRPGYSIYPGAEPKANIRDAVQYVRSSAMGGDAAINPTRMLFTGPLRHYLRGSDMQLLAQNELPNAQRCPSLWVFYGVPEGYDAQRHVPPGYNSVGRKDFDGVVVYHFVDPLLAPTTRTADAP